MSDAQTTNGLLVLIQGGIFVWALSQSFIYIDCLREIAPCPITYFHIPGFEAYFQFFPALSLFVAAMILSLITIFKFYRRKGIDYIFVLTQTGLVVFNHYFLETILPKIVNSALTI